MVNVNFSTASTAATYAVAGTLLTATAYKVSQYLFFSGYETSRIKPFFVASATALGSLALKAHLNPDWSQIFIIPFTSYVAGILLVVTFIATQMFFEGSEIRAEIDPPPIDFKIARENSFRPLLAQIEDKNLIVLEGPSTLNKVDFINFYLKEKRLNVHNLPPQYCNEESFFQYGQEILSICEKSKAILYLLDSDWLLNPDDLSHFYQFVKHSPVQIIFCAETIDTTGVKIERVTIPAASEAEVMQILSSKSIDIEEQLLLLRAASFSFKEASPGSVIQLYNSYKKQKSINLIDYLCQKLQIHPFWLRVEDNTADLANLGNFGAIIKIMRLRSIYKENTSLTAPLASVVFTGGSDLERKSIVQTIAEKLFKGRLITISSDDLQLRSIESIILSILVPLKKHSQQVIFLKNVDKFLSSSESLLIPFVNKVLKGEFEGLSLRKSLIIITAKDTAKIPADWIPYVTRISLLEDPKKSLSIEAEKYLQHLIAVQNAQHGVERDTEAAELLTAVLQHKGAIVIGPVASGKTDLLLKLSQQELQGREIVRLNQTSFTGNSKYLGEFEDHVEELKGRVKSNRSILVIEGSALLIREVFDDHYQFAAKLETMIEEGGFSTLITLTEEEYKKLKDQSPKLVSQLKQIDLKPLTEPQTSIVLKQVKPQLDEKAISTVLQYASYLKGSLPGSAMNFLNQMTGPIDEQMILKRFIQELKIDLEWLQKGHPGFGKKIESAKAALKQEIHGQDKAIDTICDTIQVRHLGLSPSPTKTLGNFLIQGLPGVGKTYFAELLSKHLFQSNFIRIDMQHLIDPRYLVKLTEHGGLLSKLNDHPFSVVLLDEIEKAPREAQDALLGILQDGRFVDKKGYEIRFDHVVIVMTSNAKKLEQHFTEAFISRLTPILFNPLSQEALKLIIQDRLKAISTKCESQGVVIDLSPSIDYLLKKMQKSGMNARDLDRFLEQEVSLKLPPLLHQTSKKFTACIEQESLTFKAE